VNPIWDIAAFQCYLLFTVICCKYC